MNGMWRIEELRELAADALAAAPPAGESSGRVREVPDVRMIRYYTTIGLIDRPAEMRGRTAYYAPRHLRQLVAIKRLQSRGLSLVEIQETLAGMGAKKLDQLAALPDGFVEAALTNKSDGNRKASPRSAAAERSEATVATRDRAPFWAAAPQIRERDHAATLPPREASVSPQMAVILPLDSGVSLLLEGIPPDRLSAEVVASLQPALAMLRRALVQAGLSHRSQDVDTGQFDQHGKDEENRR